MGGSGGLFPKDFNPSTMKKWLRQIEKETLDRAFEAKVSNEINKLLVDYNDRDTDAISSHIDTIKTAIEKEIDGTINVRFGGSVQKHTYVDGLSDIDSLVFLNNSELMDKTPKEVMEYFRDRLRERLPETQIKIGKLAVTVKFSDGKEIQLLPAIRSDDGFKISTNKGDSWSKINPQRFTDKLRQTNELNKGKVIPVIKLVKGINSTFPESRQLESYHIESLAIETFKRYSGEKTTKPMLECFFEKAKDLVKSPIRDKSGESVNVDDYLGRKDSEKRKLISVSLGRVSRRMKNANASSSVDEWLDILGQ